MIIRKLLISRRSHQPLVSSRLCRLGIDPSKLEAIYSLPLSITDDTKPCMFQCKIIHDILLYGRKFYMTKIVNSLRYIDCNLFETLPHMLVDCKLKQLATFGLKLLAGGIITVVF